MYELQTNNRTLAGLEDLRQFRSLARSTSLLYDIGERIPSFFHEKSSWLDKAHQRWPRSEAVMATSMRAASQLLQWFRLDAVLAA